MLNAQDVFDATGRGPLAMTNLAGIQLDSAVKRQGWMQQARASALAGSCPKSHNSVRSGLRCYQRFAERILGKKGNELPPTIDELLAWSTLFRCSKTFGNYMNHVSLGCQLLGLPTAVFDDRGLLRAKRAIAKKRQFVARGQMFLRQDTVGDLLVLAGSIPTWQPMAMLYLASYVFLLRVPSEGLPITVGINGASDGQAVVICTDEETTLKLKCRKNRPGGSTLVRHCWCKQCKETCPVHVLGAWFRSLQHGQRAFGGISAARALATLREWLALLRLADAEMYRLHDFRRGHARDLQASGANLATILAAGEWRSPAFLQYLDKEELENQAVQQMHLDAHMDDSSGDEQ
jgi:hypothetical protein